MNCSHCQEPVGEGQQCGAFEQPMHHECGFRTTVGSAGHLLRRCSCYGGDLEDPPGLTRREAARAALYCQRLIEKLFPGEA